MLGSLSASAQTYTGYLKLDDVNEKGPDSLLVTISVPEDTYVRDTVYLSRRELKDLKKSKEYDGRVYYDTPWMFGVKTNLLSDAIVVPYAGIDVQIARKLSLNLSGWYTPVNIFYPNDDTSVYGFAPELRWWLGDRAMGKGYFAGLHANVAWYTLEWKDKSGEVVKYQNGIEDIYDPGTMYPSWSVGATYGYSLPLDRRQRWNLEFYMGVGYASYQHKVFFTTEAGKRDYRHEVNSYIGITKVGIDLTYRFSLRRVKGNGVR